MQTTITATGEIPRGFNGPEKYFTEIRNEEESFHAAMNYTFSPNKVISSIKLNLFYDDGSRDYYQYKYSHCYLEKDIP